MANLNESVLNKVCRTCLRPSADLESLYQHSTEFDVSFAEMLMSYIPLQFHEQDELPTQICCNCIGELIRFNTFKWRCLESDAMLRNCSETTTHALIYNKNSSKYSLNASYIGYPNKSTTNNNIKEELLDDASQLEMDTSQYTHLDTKHEIDIGIINTDVINASFDDSDTNSQTNRSKSVKKAKKLKQTTICDSVCIQKSHVDAPARSHKAKLNKCDICHMTFDRKAHLARHIRMHTGEKPYACPHCSDTFNNKSNLTVHMRKHTKEKPYACDVCGIAYSQSNSLTVHMQTHSDKAKSFACTVCDKVLTRKTNLTRHMLIHDGAKPYACEVCGESFHKERLLSVHMRIHGGEETFPCSVCGKLFKRKGHMTRHLKLHSK